MQCGPFRSHSWRNAHYERWLAPVDAEHLPVDLLRPFPVNRMVAWKVSAVVGNVKNNEQTLVQPV